MTMQTLDAEHRASESLLHFIRMIQCRNICPICNLAFLTKMNLYQHINEYHAGMSFTCDCCNVICDTWLKFLEHSYSVHRHVVFCPYCYKAHSKHWRLRLHWRMHGKKIYYQYDIMINSFLNQIYCKFIFAHRAVRVRIMLQHI